MRLAIPRLKKGGVDAMRYEIANGVLVNLSTDKVRDRLFFLGKKGRASRRL